VTGTQSTGGDLMSIQGMVPLSEISDYQSRLRSVTGGQGAYTMEFSHYAPVPPPDRMSVTISSEEPPYFAWIVQPVAFVNGLTHCGWR
jgi:elongation factor G